MRKGRGLLLAALAILTAACPAGERVAPNRVPADEDGKTDGAIDRATWVAGQIQRWNADLDEATRAEKYEEMARSPLTFFRATNHLFWADHARDPRLARFGDPGTITFLAGDVHPQNFGAYDVDGRIVYDLNDVDDAIPGEAQLDVWRLAVGVTLAAEAVHLDGPGVVDAMTAAYLATLAAAVGSDEEVGRTFTAETTEGRLKAFLEKTADKESRAELLEKWTLLADGRRRLNTGLDKLVPADPAVEAELREALSWHEVKDVGLRLHAGVSSLGQPRYYVLVEGPSAALDDDVVLDVKRQPGPTAYRFIGWRARAAYDAAFTNHADRAIRAGVALRSVDDEGEGWLQLSQGAFTVRPLSPWKKDLDLDDLDTQEALEELAGRWGVILATDHARADDDADPTWASSLEVAVIERTGDGQGYRALVREVAAEDALQVAADLATFLRDVR